MAERWDARRLVSRRMRVRPAASILVGLITLITLVLAAVIPRLVERQATAELASQLQTIGPVGRSLQATGNFPEDWPEDPPPNLDQLYSDLNSNFELTRQNLDQPLRGLVGPPTWIVQTTTIKGVPQQGSRPLLGLQLTADPRYLSRIRIVQGTAPATWSKSEVSPPDQTRAVPVDVVISTGAAQQLNLKVGDEVATDVIQGVPDRLYRVSGVFEPADPGSDFWMQNPSLLPVTTALAQYGVAYPSLSAFVDPLSVGRLATTFAPARVSLFYSVRATGADGADAPLLLRQLAAAATTGASSASSFTALPIDTRSDDAVETAVQRGTLLGGLLALLAAAPLGLIFAVMVLGVQVVMRARRSELVLAAARGGSAWQLRGELALEGALLSVPSAIVVTALATILIPVRSEPAGFVLPALVALTPPILFAALAVTRERPGTVAAILLQLRGIAEIAVIGLAALSVFLLARRGLAQATTQVGVDPLLSVAPLLLAVSVGILVLRVYPLPMRAARRLAVGARGLPAFVGAIRATRAPTIGLAGVLALVVGISVALFSTVLLSTFESSVDAAARESVGADARVDGSTLSAAQQNAVAKIDGVRQVAAIEYLSSLNVAQSPVSSVAVLLAQTAPLSTMRTLPPHLNKLTDGRIPAVVSSDVFAQLGHDRDLVVQGVEMRVVGKLPANSGLGPQSNWMMIDSTFSPRFVQTFVPATLLIKADPSKLADMYAPLHEAMRVTPGVDPLASPVVVATVPQAIADRNGEPVIAGLLAGLIVGAILSALLCALALVLATAAAAATRARTAGILRTLGMPRRRLGVLIAWELVPVAVVALVAGAALGISLPFVLTAAVDLRPFTGSLHQPVPLLDPGLLGLVLGAFSLVVLISGLVAVAVGDRVNPSSTLKMGA
ncbi:MAG: FtsX-like permease family protein [Pseudolysinimonas sp.]